MTAAITIYIIGFLISGAIINHTDVLSDRIAKDDKLSLAMVLALGSWMTILGLYLKVHFHNPNNT